jgi:hypothetical protein
MKGMTADKAITLNKKAAGAIRRPLHFYVIDE